MVGSLVSLVLMSHQSAAGVALIVAAAVAHACAQYSRDKVNGPRWLLLMLAAGGVVTIYFIIIPRQNLLGRGCLSV